MSDIFISYSRPDRERAQALALVIEARGWSVWWDRDLVGGSSFAEEIGNQLDQARVVIVLWSLSSAQSQWVQGEAMRAGRRMVPVKIESVEPPLPFNTLHTLDLVGWQGLANCEQYQALERTLEHRAPRERNARQENASLEPELGALHAAQAATAPPVYASVSGQVPPTAPVNDVPGFAVPRRLGLILLGLVAVLSLPLLLHRSKPNQPGPMGAPASTGSETLATAAIKADSPHVVAATAPATSEFAAQQDLSLPVATANASLPGGKRDASTLDRAKVSVAAGKTTPSADAVESFIHANFPSINKRCLTRLGQAEGIARGFIEVHFMLNAQGIARRVTSDGNLTSPQLRSCVEAEVMRLKFPVPKDTEKPQAYKFWFGVQLPKL